MESHYRREQSLEVYNLLSELKNSMIEKPRPVLLEFKPSECADMKRQEGLNIRRN
jgi:hypothetical protein